MTQRSTIQAFTTGSALARLILIAAVAAGSFHHAGAQELPPTVVVTEPMQSLDFAEQVRLVGRTRAWSESRITAEVSGRLAAIDAEEGVFVTKGAPLLTLDCERTRLSLVSKQAETKQAEISAELASTQLIRTEELHGRNLASQTALDSAAAWAGIQEARHRQLGAERDRLALDLDRCTIRAPFAGYTGRRMVDVGEWVDAGDDVFELSDISRIRVRADLPERYFGQVSVGSTATVQRGGNAEYTVTGRVSGIGARASDETHTFPVTLTVANPDEALAGGMVVRVRLELNDQFTSLSVSKDAIVRQAGQTMVYTVVEGKAVRLPVVTVSERGDQVAIQGEGLREGMPVVVRGNERIFPGSAVMVAGNGADEGAAPAGSP